MFRITDTHYRRDLAARSERAPKVAPPVGGLRA